MAVSSEYKTVLYHGARWAFAGRDFHLQFPSSNTLPFSRIFSVSYATRPRPCRLARSPSHSSVKAFWGGQRFTFSPSRAAVTNVHRQLANAMLLILSPALPAIFTACHVWKSALCGYVLRPNRPGRDRKPARQRSRHIFIRELYHFISGFTTLVYLVFFIHSQASHAGSTIE